MRVLAIETSCDETGIALVEGSKTPGGFAFTVHTEALLSQAHLHAPYGGVYPNIAKREHQKNLPILFEQFAGDEFEAVAVTAGPGLEPALWQGIEFAKKIAVERGVPLIPANHMEGHLLSSLAVDGKLENIRLPLLALLISGGHTEFVLMREWFVYKVLGETLDDAVGECFDKVARMLGLPYPGGPHISKLAETARKRSSPHKGPRVSSLADNRPVGKVRPDHLLGDFSFSLPRPMLHSKDFDMSFSGLKTAALYALRNLKATPSRAKESPLTQEEKQDFAREFEDAVAEVFVAKTRGALEESGAQTFVIGGGVAANTHIRRTLEKLITEEFPDTEFRLPDLSITGDNAVMIAEAALARSLAGVQKNPDPGDIRAVGNLSIAS